MSHLETFEHLFAKVVLDGLTNMLNMADANGKTTEMTTCLEEADALDHLEKLQEHENEVSNPSVFLKFTRYSDF